MARRRAKVLKPQRKVPGPPPSRELQYKVVELSTVDESALERTLNEVTREGWTLENIQFAMRESSKRPAMAFLFFTREGAAAPAQERQAQARARLSRLAEVPPPQAWNPGSARQRLIELAGGLDDDEDGKG